MEMLSMLASSIGAAGRATDAAIRRAVGRPWATRALPRRPDRPDRPRIVILGAGFGGITTAIEVGRLARRGFEADVLLVDRVNFHLFTPMLYQVATGLVEPGHVEYPTRDIARTYGFRFREGQIDAIDLDHRQVIVAGARLDYDRLVIALGSVTNYFGNASIERHAASLKTLGDAVAIRNRVIEAFERAEVESDPAARRALLTFVVVGGGATGVELIGSLHTLIQNGLLPLYPFVDRRDVRLMLAEAGPALLNGMDSWIGETAVRRLREKGVEVSLANPATEVRADGITFKDGHVVESRTVVWAAGVRPSPLTAALTVERGRDGRLVVDERLRLPSHPDVFAIGDCAWFPVAEQGGRPAPPNAQTAVRQARVAARNVAASLYGRPLAPYHYANEGNLVALGQGDGVALIGARRLEGFPAWLTWRGFYLAQLMGFMNRLEVLVEWTSSYFGHRGRARLDVGEIGDGRPPAPSAPARASAATTEAAAPTAPQPAAPVAEQSRSTAQPRQTRRSRASATGTKQAGTGTDRKKAETPVPGRES